MEIDKNYYTKKKIIKWTFPIEIIYRMQIIV